MICNMHMIFASGFAGLRRSTPGSLIEEELPPTDMSVERDQASRLAPLEIERQADPQGGGNRTHNDQERDHTICGQPATERIEHNQPPQRHIGSAQAAYKASLFAACPSMRNLPDTGGGRLTLIAPYGLPYSLN